MQLFDLPTIPEPTFAEIISQPSSYLTNPRIIGGAIVGSSIAIGSGNTIFKADENGIYLGNTTFASAPFRVSMSGSAVATDLTLTGGTIKYGKTTFADTTNAGYYISSDGLYVGAASDASKLKYTISSGVFDFIGTISSRSTATIAGAINASGNFIDANLNTATKTILKDFTFGSTDYSGAFKTGTITWNTTTGAITGGSGGLFNKAGIIFANAGVATLTLDGTTGNATFAGTLSAAAGTLGTITSGSIYSGLFSTSTSGSTTERIEMGISVGGNVHNIIKYNSSNQRVIGIGGVGATTMIDVTNYGVSNSCIDLTQTINQVCLGLTKSGTGAGAIIDIANDGTGYDIDGNGSNWYCEKDGTGNFKFLSLVKLSSATTEETLLSISSDYESAGATCVSIANTGGATVTSPAVTISGDIRGSLLYVNATDVSTNSNVKVASVGDLPNIEIIKTTNSGIGAKIGMTSNDANESYGLEFNIANAGAGIEHAFKFSGSEYIASATGVSGLTGVVKISTSDGTCYLPVYSSYS